MIVGFHQYCENQTNKIDHDKINQNEEGEKFEIKTEKEKNILTKSNNENLVPQESETKIFKKNGNKNINISNSIDKEKDCYNITKRVLSIYRYVWIVLIIWTIAILIIILALNTGNKKFNSK